MALDRDAERVLEMVRMSGRPAYETLSAPEARELFLAAREVLAPNPPPVAEIRELSAPGPAGTVPLRLYRGARTIRGENFPALVYFHGGGRVIGNLDTP
jgi:acetyl esterase/lipase